MVKKILGIILSFFLLCGCTTVSQTSTNSSTETTQSEIETKQLASALDMEKLVKVKNRVVLGMVFGGDKDAVKEASMYRSNADGNYDMVAIVYPKDLDACLNYIDDYLNTLKTECNKNYPQEVFKISNAIVKHNDSKIIVVITSDIENARVEVEKILENQ